MSTTDETAPQRGPKVADPYVGAAPKARRRARRWLMPSLIGFCLIMGLLFAFLAPYLVVPLMIPVAALLLVAIWSLPNLRAAPNRTLEAMFFIFFAALILWPNYLCIVLPGLPWITMIRLTGFPLVLLLLVCVSVSKEFRVSTREALKGIPQTWKLVVAFAVVQLLSLAFSRGGEIADSVQRLVLYLVSWTGVFFVSVYVFRKPRRVEAWAFIMWAAAIVIGLIGLQEERHSHVPWAGHIPRFLQIDPTMLQTILAGNSRAANGIYRIQSVFSSPLTLAEYLAFTFPFLIHFTFARGYSWWIRFAAAASMPFILVIIFFSGSRLGMVGAFLSMLGYLLYWALNRWLRDRRSLLGPGITLTYPAIFVAAVAATYFIGRLHSMVWGDSATKASNEGRIEQYHKGIPLVIHHPLGFGVDRGAAALGIMSTDGKLTIDTYYLAIALNYGVVGFCLFYGFILWTIWRGGLTVLRVPRDDRDLAFMAPLAIALANFFVIASIFAQQDNIPLVFMMVGMMVALVWRAKRVLGETGLTAVRKIAPVYRARPLPAPAKVGG